MILNITLPEGAAICNGKQVTFRAPCDCTGVTGLKIGDITYTLLTTVNEPIDTNYVFVKDALVSVIIDTENNRAYIQNGAASGSGGARKRDVTLLASDWDSNKSQIANVPSVSSDESTQLIHIIPSNEDLYISYGIIASVESTGLIKFIAEETPTEDIYLSVVIEDIGVVNPEAPDEVVLGPESKVFIAKVPVNWTKYGNFYYQDIAVDGMSSKYDPIISCQYGDDQDMNAQYKKAFSLVHDVDTLDGSVRIWCTSAPTIEFIMKFTIMGWYWLGEDLEPAEGVEF